jgi:Family of unknown function (DUF6221)
MVDDLPPFGGLTPAGTVICKNCRIVIVYSTASSQWLDASGTALCSPSTDGDLLGHDPGWSSELLPAPRGTRGFREWLLEQISQDEQAVNAAYAYLGEGQSWSRKWSRVIFASGTQQFVSPQEVALVATFSPARVVAECETKREVLATHPRKLGSEAECATCGQSAVDDVTGLYVVGEVWPCRTLRALAIAYADRPGYLDAWRP